jgi:Predicted flavin-nucleotide-binding protein
MKEMRRADRLLSNEETMDILNKGEYGILATVGKDGQPYGVPLSYVVRNNCIYYHAANAGGSKYDNILFNHKVSFTVVGNTKVLPEKFGTLYESVVVFGEASVVDDPEEKLTVFREFLIKYCSGYISEGEKHIENSGSKAMIVKITIASLTGKGRKS